MNSDETVFQAELADYQWLIGQEGDRWLKAAKTAVGEGASLTQLAAKLRRDLSTARTHLVLEQTELREKARPKFSLAERMFFTRLGLEQATDEWVAGYKAGRFPMDQPMADFCCGIGGDLLALAARGRIWAVDKNQIARILARANLQAVLGNESSIDAGSLDFLYGDYGVRLDSFDVGNLVLSLNGITAWHIDPDRRPVGKRTTKVELHEPGPEVLQRLLSVCPNAAIKLAPAADLTEPFWADAELEWISRGRQCRQLIAWFDKLAQHPGRRRATAVRLDAPTVSAKPGDSIPAGCVSLVATPNLEPPLASRIGRYLFEPDPAILAAKLEGALAAGPDLAAIAPGVAYFTADHPNAGSMFDAFEVLEVMPYRIKPLRQWLAARGIVRLEVKKRGVPLDPEIVRRELLTAKRGDKQVAEEITLILARVGGRVTAILTKRMPG